MSMSDRTLDVLLNHLIDLDLPTILARMADRLVPHVTLFLSFMACIIAVSLLHSLFVFFHTAYMSYYCNMVR